jgi:hypothetical protein
MQDEGSASGFLKGPTRVSRRKALPAVVDLVAQPHNNRFCANRLLLRSIWAEEWEYPLPVSQPRRSGRENGTDFIHSVTLPRTGRRTETVCDV